MIWHRLTYGILFSLLAVTFIIFTVGIPFIVSSCPMARVHDGRAACCAACADPSMPGVRPAGSSLCCRTVIAARYSTAEYVTIAATEGFDLASHSGPLALPSDESDILLHPDRSHILSFLHPHNPNFSPHGENLPVLFSSLLI
jgi:hypothetical protein